MLEMEQRISVENALKLEYFDEFSKVLLLTSKKTHQDACAFLSSIGVVMKPLSA